MSAHVSLATFCPLYKRMTPSSIDDELTAPEREMDRTPTLEEQGWSIVLEQSDPKPGWQNYAQQNAPKRKGAKKQRSKYLRKRSKD